VLIFDEVITGFRYGMGGAQAYHGVIPDLACFGKSMGNGMPISAIVGKQEIMKLMEPPNNIFYSGTFMGETLSLAASIACIDKMDRKNVPNEISLIGYDLRAQVSEIMRQNDSFDLVDFLFYTGEPLSRLKFHDRAVQDRFTELMAANGVLIIASHNLCYAFGKDELQRVLTAYDTVLRILRKEFA